MTAPSLAVLRMRFTERESLGLGFNPGLCLFVEHLADLKIYASGQLFLSWAYLRWPLIIRVRLSLGRDCFASLSFCAYLTVSGYSSAASETFTFYTLDYDDRCSVFSLVEPRERFRNIIYFTKKCSF